MELYVLALCQAQIATMAADLCLHPLRRGDDVAASLYPWEETRLDSTAEPTADSPLCPRA